MGTTQSVNSFAQDRNMSNCIKGAKLIGWNNAGEMCVWFGGYSFQVFDAAREWDEKRTFTSGKIAGLQNKDSDRGRELAKDRMELDGFTVIE